MRQILGLSIILISTLFQLNVHAAPPPNASRDTFELTYRGEYFFSDTNLSQQSGDTDKLGSDQDYHNFSNFFDLAYTLPSALRISAGGTFAYASSTGIIDSRSNSKFNTASVSAQYYKSFGRLLIVPHLKLEFALEDIEPFQDEVFTSEGSNRYQAGLWIRYPLWKLDNWAHLAYRHQDDDKSSHLLWSLGSRWRGGDWYVQGEVLGYSPVTDDRFTDTPFIRTNVNNNVAGGSLRYNSVNPDYIDGEVIVGYRWKGGYEFGAGATHTITGKNTGYGPTLVALLSIDFRLDERPLDPSAKVSESGSFQPDFEEYDESIFTDE